MVMADRPELFNASMVRAILREIEAPSTGKTQTRRILRPQPSKPFDSIMRVKGERWTAQTRPPGFDLLEKLPVPYAVSDRIYVRETWGVYHDDYVDDPMEPIWYRATDEPPADAAGPARWRPSIHMPRRASRITLTVTDVRVQQLQEISEEDARAEGVDEAMCYAPMKIPDDASPDKLINPPLVGPSFRVGFERLWNGLYAQRGIGWDANPWVVAVSFRPALGNIDATSIIRPNETPAEGTDQ
jgi:hypothetical protein